AASSGYTRIEQNDPTVNYVGSWETESSSLLVDFSGGSAAESASSGAQTTLSFNGTAVRWIGYKDTLSGIADVFLDGTHVATVDSYSTLPVSQVVMYSATGLSAGNHTLSIRPEGRHSLLSLGSAVWVDAFDVQPLPSDTTPPTVSMTAPANGTTVSGTVTVSANASDNVGVVGVQFELDGAALGAEDTTAPYSVSWDSTTASNGSHTLTAVARDAAGNHTTATPVTVTVSNSGGGGTTTRIEQDNPAVAYTGTWITASDSSVSGGTATETNEANATATLTFTGTGVTWISYTGPNTAGISSVSVDGGTPTQVDTYTANTVPQAKVFSVSNLPKGSHTLKITVSGTFDRAGNSAYVVVDAFDVTN
ncbi:MAG: Ig-like domain-containing protein, partial [Gammaproteobacteria bacterium]